MVDTATSLRQRIEHYRRMLAEGIPADRARVYLELIARDHAALRELEGPFSRNASAPGAASVNPRLNDGTGSEEQKQSEGC
jgi:hypothetical protein